MIQNKDIQNLIQQKQLEFNSTEPKLCIPIINRIYKKMKAGIRFSGINVEDSIICDGHHRFIAAHFAEYTLEQYPSISTSATRVTPWESVIFEDEEWESQEMIEKFNQEDAAYNGITIEKIIDMLK